MEENPIIEEIEFIDGIVIEVLNIETKIKNNDKKETIIITFKKFFDKNGVLLGYEFIFPKSINKKVREEIEKKILDIEREDEVYAE